MVQNKSHIYLKFFHPSLYPCEAASVTLEIDTIIELQEQVCRDLQDHSANFTRVAAEKLLYREGEHDVSGNMIVEGQAVYIPGVVMSEETEATLMRMKLVTKMMRS